MTSASKVGELFSAAGEAFTKLAELTWVIQTTLNNSANDCSTGCNSKSCWSTEDTELLQLAVKRFGDELNIISEHIKDKTMCQIKSTFKKIQPTISNTCKPDDSTINSHETSSYLSTTAAVSTTISSFNEFSTNNRSSMFSAEVVPTVTTTVNRPHLLSAMTLSSPSVVSTTNLVSSPSPILENVGLKAPSTITVTSVTTTCNTMANVATASATRTTSGTVVVSSSILSSQSNAGPNLSATTVASSICSSPSPFLHYPLLRKSADITLNMLNARDDSDEEDRLGNLSLFNNV